MQLLHGFKMVITIAFLKFFEFLLLLRFCFGCLSFLLCGNVSLNFVVCSYAVIDFNSSLSCQRPINYIFFLLSSSGSLHLLYF